MTKEPCEACCGLGEIDRGDGDDSGSSRCDECGGTGLAADPIDKEIKAERCQIERIAMRFFFGEEPRCQCCGKPNPDCTYRAAYQMVLCPGCPK